MPRSARFLVVAMLLLAAGDIALPPVIENHIEIGYCSADCPVQHPGSGVALREDQHADTSVPLTVGPMRATPESASPVAAAIALDAPRAPPSA
jgi:hypothetical protein